MQEDMSVKYSFNIPFYIHYYFPCIDSSGNNSPYGDTIIYNKIVIPLAQALLNN